MNNFKDIFTVAKFTMRDMIGRKSFRISTLIILILIVIGFNVPSFIQEINNGNSNETILISDVDHLFAEEISAVVDSSISYRKDPYQLEPTEDDLDTIKERINDDDSTSAIIIIKDGDSIHFDYYVKNTATSNTENLYATAEQIKSVYINNQIANLHLTKNQLDSIKPLVYHSVHQTDDQEISGNIGVMMILSCILFFAIYFCAFQVSSSITVEKTSKIIETLVTSTSPRSIILGKTIGIGLVGLGQMLLFVVTAILSAYSFLDSEILNAMLNLSNFTPYLAIITLVYFILGYFVYALLYAVTGATVSKPEDIQAANTPVVILTMIGFYLAYFTLMNPTGELNIFASLLPISSPFCMPLRVMMGVASSWDVCLSILILLITCIVVAHIAIKIYSNAILNYGNQRGLKNLFKMYKEK